MNKEELKKLVDVKYADLKSVVKGLTVKEVEFLFYAFRERLVKEIKIP